MRHTFRSDFSVRLYKFCQFTLTICTEASRRETGGQMGQADFLDEPPHSEHLTEYDRAHFETYLRLLDAEADAAHWAEAVRMIFGLDPEEQPDRAQHIHQTHLARAHWMTENGYRDLLRSAYH
ncbi:DUF2285 domain-containing protein [Rhodopseudomonas sp. BAL398]|nr:DUF2285 domain-containing protein [Rhodopseudomonas sp. BAL398]WOK17997.1 DUF2285 domain-containing protein [Rhodopseudomonas sp. BAL398]